MTQSVVQRVVSFAALAVRCSDTTTAPSPPPLSEPDMRSAAAGASNGDRPVQAAAGMGGSLPTAGSSSVAPAAAGNSSGPLVGDTPPGCAGLLFHDDFEQTDERDWTHAAVEAGLADPWVRGVAAGPACHAGSSCWSTGLSGDYQNCTEAGLISPTIDLAACTSTSSIEVSWWQWVSLETFDEGTYFDSALVQLSRDGGATWAYLPSPGPEPAYLGTCGIHDDGCGSDLPLLRGQSVWSDHALASWQLAHFAVPADYLTSAFRVRFVFGSDFKEGSRGWLIDDFAVGSH